MGCKGQRGRVEDLYHCGGASGNNIGLHSDSAITFEPGILKREGGHYYKNVCGTLRANAGDNQMAVAYRGASGQGDGLHGDSPCIYNKNRNDQYDEETVCMTVMARFGTGGQYTNHTAGNGLK